MTHAALIATLSLLLAGSPGPAQEEKTFKQEELDQLLAPIALYPDSLLSQVLIASTYPLEVVQAQRWTDAHRDLKGDPLAKELEKQTWDPGVKSLVNFPQVLKMMSEKLDWTMKLGDAFLAQQKEVMATVQKLRTKAKEAGTLKSGGEMKVTEEGGTIVIESSSPTVIYVPTYDPVVIYGPWWVPAYPPYYWYPPGYVARPGFWFGVGFTLGVAWGYGWGHCNWGHGNIDIDINRNININTHIDRNRYKAEFNRSSAGSSEWRHDASHRQGAPYRDAVTAGKFDRKPTAAREEFRGREAPASKPAPARREASGPVGRDLSGTKTGAFGGLDQGGDRTRTQTLRGNQSRGGAGIRPGGGRRR